MTHQPAGVNNGLGLGFDWLLSRYTFIHENKNRVKDQPARTC